MKAKIEISQEFTFTDTGDITIYIRIPFQCMNVGRTTWKVCELLRMAMCKWGTRSTPPDAPLVVEVKL